MPYTAEEKQKLLLKQQVKILKPADTEGILYEIP